MSQELDGAFSCLSRLLPVHGCRLALSLDTLQQLQLLDRAADRSAPNST
jgi:hypothetical protein